MCMYVFMYVNHPTLEALEMCLPKPTPLALFLSGYLRSA
jgi:hypothetical protein